MTADHRRPNRWVWWGGGRSTWPGGGAAGSLSCAGDAVWATPSGMADTTTKPGHAVVPGDVVHLADTDEWRRVATAETDTRWVGLYRAVRFEGGGQARLPWFADVVVVVGEAPHEEA